jgi:ParD-like antitoxin of type II bacterial toxin-antitoxin system
MEAPMAINVKLPEALVEKAKHYGAIEHRSVPKQIEYWSQIGKIAAENPDLPFSVIRDILIANQEEPSGEYQFG